jgi:hypothetical protein
VLLLTNLAQQMYTALDKRASQYVDRFHSESEELYAAEEANDSPVNMAALVLRSLSFMCQARDHAVESASDAMRMGSRLGFFRKGKPSLMVPQEISDDDARMNAYVAWGTFCWHVSVHSETYSLLPATDIVLGILHSSTDNLVLKSPIARPSCRFPKIESSLPHIAEHKNRMT